MARSRVALLVLSLALIVGGVLRLQGGVSKPVEVALADLGHKSENTWLRVNGGKVLLRSLVASERANGSIDEAFVPVVVSEDEEVHLLLRTRRPSFLATARELSELNRRSLTDSDRYIDANRAKLVLDEAVSGLIEARPTSDDPLAARIAGIRRLAPDFQVIRDGAEPEQAGGPGLLLAGLVLLAGVAAPSALAAAERRSKLASKERIEIAAPVFVKAEAPKLEAAKVEAPKPATTRKSTRTVPQLAKAPAAPAAAPAAPPAASKTSSKRTAAKPISSKQVAAALPAAEKPSSKRLATPSSKRLATPSSKRVAATTSKRAKPISSKRAAVVPLEVFDSTPLDLVSSDAAVS